MTAMLVVGGGPAGAAVATHLARAGRDVVLVEREASPSDKVCGEFLSAEATAYLLALGLDPMALGAVVIDTLRLCIGDEITAVRLPFVGLGLSRRVLDEAMLEVAARAGVDVRRGVKVMELARVADGWSARVSGGGEVAATSAFLATGKHDVRGYRRPPGRQDDLVGFKVLPDSPVRFKDVWLGAIVTTALFLLGKFGVGLYLTRADVASTYGAAGSVVVMLLWVYYSAQIFFFGAEFTHAHARLSASRATTPTPA